MSDELIIDTDWADLRERLAAATARRRTTAKSARAILDERARALARPVAERRRGDDAADVDVLLVRRGTTTWAFRLADVAEIVRRAALTPLPGADAPVAALLPWRGRMLTVLDLARGAPLAAAPLVVVVSAGSAVIGVVADAADEVRTLHAGELHAADAASAADASVSAVVGTTTDGIALLTPSALVPRLAPRSVPDA